jgi:hypothetical protein
MHDGKAVVPFLNLCIGLEDVNSGCVRYWYIPVFLLVPLYCSAVEMLSLGYPDALRVKPA